MHWIFIVSLLVSQSYWAKAEEENEISEPDSKLDRSLRRALLQALSDLETGDDSKLPSNSLLLSGTGSGVQHAKSASFSIIHQTSTSDKPSTTESSTTAQSEKTVFAVQRSSSSQPITSYITLKPNSKQFLNSVTTLGAKIKSATEKPITSTTPLITTSTEESEAKVEDLQFFAAPLVAAFTVHQDEHGLPKSVVPILKEPDQESITAKQIEEQRVKDLLVIQKKQEEVKYKEEQIKLQQYLRNQEQIRLQQELETKRKILEQQIQTLQQQQQRHQEYLLQQQKLIQERERLKPNNYNRYTSITVEPALSIQPESYIDNTLQLPTKNHQNFQELPFNQYQQLPVHGPANFHAQFPTADNIQDFRQNRPHGNRVFRHESGTGNFANSNFNTQNKFYSNTFNQPRFFRSNQESYSITPSVAQDYHSARIQRAPFVNNQLNNLLYYAGISRGRQQEDLSIISKVLSFGYVPGV